MELGKLPNNQLEKLILNTLITRRDETVLKPAVGEDCCALNLGDNLCVISTDPITAADENAGVLAVLVSLNDLAASGAEPVGILTTVLLPPEITSDKIARLFKTINDTCASVNIDLLGGHTEITDSVNKIVIITTAIGKVPPNGLIRSDGAIPGDAILMTKAAGLEGTAIIASDKEKDIRDYFTKEEIKTAKSFINEISVIPEGTIAAKHKANAMHDVTEGGVLGAVWEICKASGCGAQIYFEKIPVRDVTLKLCKHYNIDPTKLISSGSMIIVCSQVKKQDILSSIIEQGIDCTEIGIITENTDVFIIKDTKKIPVYQPDSDELYKVRFFS